MEMVPWWGAVTPSGRRRDLHPHLPYQCAIAYDRTSVASRGAGNWGALAHAAGALRALSGWTVLLVVCTLAGGEQPQCVREVGQRARHAVVKFEQRVIDTFLSP